MSNKSDQIPYQWIVDGQELGLNKPLPADLQFNAPNDIELVTYDSSLSTEQHKARSKNLDILYRGGWDKGGNLNLNEKNQLPLYMFQPSFLTLQFAILKQATKNYSELLPFISVFLLLKLFFYFATVGEFIEPHFTAFVDANVDPITVSGAILAYMPMIIMVFLMPLGSLLEKIFLLMAVQTKGVYVGAGGFILYAMTLNPYHSNASYFLLFGLIIGCHYVEHSMLVLNKFGMIRDRVIMSTVILSVVASMYLLTFIS